MSLNYSISAIFTLRQIAHFQEKENSYTQKQEHTLKFLLQSTDTIESEITHTEKALKERLVVVLIQMLGESNAVSS